MPEILYLPALLFRNPYIPTPEVGIMIVGGKQKGITLRGGRLPCWFCGCEEGACFTFFSLPSICFREILDLG